MTLVDRTGDNPTTLENIEKSNKGKSIFWKIRMILVVIILISVLIIVGTSFYAQSHSIYVDNPTGSGITFKIGDKPEQKLNPYSHLSYTLSPGKYNLMVNGKNVGSFEKKYFDTHSFLNPTGDIYIQEYILFGDEKYTDKLPNNHIEVYGNETDGPFKAYSGVYITGDWNYNLDDSIPSEVKIKRGKDYSIKSKIYRFEDFVSMDNQVYVDQSSTGSVENSTSTGMYNN